MNTRMYVETNRDLWDEFPKTVENCCSYEEVEPGRYEPRLRHGVVIPSLFSIRAVNL